MLKPLALAAMIGAFGGQSFTEDLKSTTALGPDQVPLHSVLKFHGGEGADDVTELAGDYRWQGGGQGQSVGLYKIHYEGGEGGEGGEGYRKHKHKHHHYHRKHHKHHKHKHRHRHHHHHYHHQQHYPRYDDGYDSGPDYIHAGPAVVPRGRPSASCGSKKLVGALLGAAAGGFVGSQFGRGDGQLAAVAGGTVLGLFLGHEVGAYLDQSDAACAQQAAQYAYAAPLGTEVAWNNPQTGHRGTIQPLRDGTSSSGQYCREFQQTVVIGGRSERAYGVACRQPDGSWSLGDY